MKDVFIQALANAQAQGRKPKRWVLGWRTWLEISRDAGWSASSTPPSELTLLGYPASVEKYGIGFGLVVR